MDRNLECQTRNPKINRFLSSCIASILVAASGCDRIERGGDLEEIQDRGELVVLTRNAPTMVFEDRDGLTGLEYEMVESFANHLGVKLQIRFRETISEILEDLSGGKADLAAAGLTKTLTRSETYLTGPTYQTVQQQVVCRRGGPRPRGVNGLAGVELAVAAESSYVEHLVRLKKDHPELEWRVTEDVDTEQLLEQVWEEELDCTVADSNIVAINRRYYPELIIAFNLTNPEPLAWHLPPGADALRGAVGVWFDEYEASGRLKRLMDRYYGFVKIYDFVDTRAFLRRIDQVLPRYEALFRRAAKEFGLSWTLLAAQSYQESHWKPRAESPTGVKGIMMLTLPTAEAMGVKDRLDPKQSIRGGAKYLVRIRDRLPNEIEEPNRTWFALAAYNVGMAHLRDARLLARRLGKDANRWGSLSEVLPLLAQKKYYLTLKHGYARGREPVRYVNRIRNYRDILEQTMR